MPLKRYTTTVAPQKLGLDTFREGPLGAVLFGGPAGAPMFVLLSLLTAPDPAASIGQLNGSLQPAPAKAGSSPGDAAKPESPAFVIDLPDGPDLVLRVNPATKLLAGIELEDRPRAVCQERSGRNGPGDRTVWLDVRPGLNSSRRRPIVRVQAARRLHQGSTRSPARAAARKRGPRSAKSSASRRLISH